VSRRLSLATDGSLAEEKLVVAPTTAQQSDAIHAALERFWKALEAAIPEPPGQEWRQALATAVMEIATNVMRHAYPENTIDRGLSLLLRLYPDEVVVWLTDRGIALATLPDLERPPTGDPLDLPEGGYGLALARACVDVLEYSRTPEGTNRWRLVKRL
jgi:anti-sigma regulatory factor (Ser/Thr protein kinase)